MIVFDTDILTEILVGAPEFVARAARIPRHEQAVPVVAKDKALLPAWPRVVNHSCS